MRQPLGGNAQEVTQMKESHPLQIALAILALLGVGIGIGAVITIVILNSPLKPKEVSVGPVSYEIPTSQPQTPVVKPGFPTATSAPQGPSLQSLGTIRVFGNSNLRYLVLVFTGSLTEVVHTQPMLLVAHQNM